MKKRQVLYVLLSAVLLLCLGTYKANAEEEQPHQHKSFVWSCDESYHWHICVGDGVCPDNWIFDYGPHDYKGGDVCVVCGYDRRNDQRMGTLWVTEMNVLIPAPAAGDYMYTYPMYDASQATVSGYSYDPPIPGGMQGVFDYGTTYTITIDIESVPGHWFVEHAPTPCTVNGQPAEFIYVNGSQAKIRYTFPPTAAAPEAPKAETITIPAYVRVNGATESTPSPGSAVFHFKIWCSDASIPLNIISNAVTTSGFGEFSNNLVFTVPADRYEALKSASIYIQQYDGNLDWQFDTREFYFFWYSSSFKRWGDATIASAPKIPLDYAYVTNIYNPQTAPPAPPETSPEPEKQPEPPAPGNFSPVPPDTSGLKELPVEIIENEDETKITLPVYIGVERYSSDVPPAAVFHFGIYGMYQDQEYEWVNDVVYTEGEGIYSGTISFTVPSDQLDQLLETGFDVRERSAIVPGWSFAGEVYHIDLSRKEGEDGEITAEIRRLRNVTTASSGLRILYFLNLYGMENGVPEEMPGNVIGIEDVLREIHGMEYAVFSDTFRFEKDGGKWKVTWSAVKKGYTIGSVNVKIRYAKNGGKYEEYKINDILRVTKDGIFIKLRALADAYSLLKGKDFPGAETIPEDEWTGFTQDEIPWLDLHALDELFRRIRNNSGRVFDELPVVTTGSGYAFSGGIDEWNDFRMMALNIAQLYHEDWYALALKAAVSEEMQYFAADYEDAFMAFNEMEMNNAGLISLIKEKYPRAMKKFEYTLENQDGVYTSEFFSKFADGKDVWVIDNYFEAEEASEEDVDEENMTAPEEYGSGSDFFHAMIMRQAPELLWGDAETEDADD